MKGAETRQTLLARIQTGDEIGWREFYHIYKGFVLAVAQNALAAQNLYLTQEEMADLLHDVMCELLKPGRFRYDPAKGRFRSWFASVIRHKLTDLVRRKFRRIPDSSCQAASETEQPGHVLAVEVFDSIWQQEWARHLVQQAFLQLSTEVEPVTLRAFELVVIHELAPPQVAAELHIPVARVHLAKHRCGKRLRTLLAALQNQEGPDS